MRDAVAIMNQIFQLMLYIIPFAVVTAVLESGKPMPREYRAKSLKDVDEILSNYIGWALFAVDKEKCGYCGVAKAMIGLAGIPHITINITDVPEDDLAKLVEKYSIEHVPALVLVEYGDVVLVKHFKGREEEDAEILKEIKAYAV